MSNTSISVGIVGLGEIGTTFARGLRAAGVSGVVAYDAYASNGDFSELIRRRADEIGIRLADSPADLAATTRLILDVTPGTVCEASAGAFKDVLQPEHSYVALASTGPDTKTSIYEALQGTGANVCDGAILGSPKDGHAMPIIISGPGANLVKDALSPLGMKIEVVSATVGAATAIKIIRSVITKGVEALLTEGLLAARRHSIDEYVVTSLSRIWSKPFEQTVNNMLTTSVIHAERRAEEATMSADTLKSLGLDSMMSEATSQRLARTAQLGLKSQLGGEAPSDWREALRLIEEASAKAGRAHNIQ